MIEDEVVKSVDAFLFRWTILIVSILILLAFESV